MLTINITLRVCLLPKNTLKKMIMIKMMKMMKMMKLMKIKIIIRKIMIIMMFTCVAWISLVFCSNCCCKDCLCRVRKGTLKNLCKNFNPKPFLKLDSAHRT